MGMDLVEIVVAVEERFGLAMTSQDWQSLGAKATVEDLADWVWEHLPEAQRTAEAANSEAENAASLERAALHWLQTQLQQLLPVAAPTVEAFPATLPLTHLPGRPSLRWLYAELRKTGIDLPPLFLSAVQKTTIAAIGQGLALICIWFAFTSGERHFYTLIASGIPGLLIWAGLSIWLARFTAATSTADTIGEFARQILTRNPVFFSQQAGIRLNRQQVNHIVIRILIENLGVDPEEVKLDARLIDDLGMD